MDNVTRREVVVWNPEEAVQEYCSTWIWYSSAPGQGTWRRPGRGGRYRGPGSVTRVTRSMVVGTIRVNLTRKKEEGG